MMKIRKANIDDLEVILHLRDEARKIMRSDGNMRQWADGYPLEKVFINDIQQGNSYLIEEDEKAVGTFAFIPSPEPTYARIFEGTWLEVEHPYFVIHRIASTPESHGTLSTLMDFCFSKTDNIRIDTHRDNRIMRHCLAKLGFSYRGIIFLENGDERLAFQRILDKPA